MLAPGGTPRIADNALVALALLIEESDPGHCGKSLTMAFYAGRLILHPALENPTIVVLTDRNVELALETN